jgi:hypothetical protein
MKTFNSMPSNYFHHLVVVVQRASMALTSQAAPGRILTMHSAATAAVVEAEQGSWAVGGHSASAGDQLACCRTL